MKITIYELLGLMKDGKAPKKIKCYSRNFLFIDGDYICTDICEANGLSIFKWIYGQNLNDEDYERAAQVNSSTQLYKQAGNSIVVNILEAILKELLINE